MTPAHGDARCSIWVHGNAEALAALLSREFAIGKR